MDLSLGEEPSVANEGISADFSLLSITTNMSKSTWDQGFLNLGGNADYITFDFSAYNATITSVSFDVTIPNWAETKNTIAYHWGNASNTTYNISGASTEIVSLTAPANAKSFTIQRSAGTGTRISEVCFQIEGNEPTESISSVVPKTAVVKIIREGRLLILRDNKTFDITGRRVN